METELPADLADQNPRDGRVVPHDGRVQTAIIARERPRRGLDIVDKGKPLWGAERLRARTLAATVAHSAADISSLRPA